jgi:hypothetical protein
MKEKESKSSSHFWISMCKSVVRILACIVLFDGNYKMAAGLLLIAESLGIVEEI